MGHKRDYHGGFGVDKTEKKSVGLMLPIRDEGNNFPGRVVDLRKIQPGAFWASAKKAPSKKSGHVKLVTLATRRSPISSSATRQGRKKKITAEIKNLAKKIIEPMALFKQFPQSQPMISEPLEISPPEREDILAMMEEIEVINNSLRNQTWRVETDYADEPVAVIEPAAASDLPEIEDWEDYLGFKAETPIMAEPDILESLLVEPDAAGFCEIQNTVIATPFSSQTRPEIGLVQEGSGGMLNSGAPVPVRDESPAKVRTPIKDLFLPGRLKLLARHSAGFLSAGFLIYLVIFGLSLAGQGLLAKDNILSSALQAYKFMLAGKDSAANLNFSAAGVNFETAYQNFLLADQELNKMGRGIIYILEKMPGGSPVGSGAALVSAGENFAKAGQSFSQIADIFMVQNLGDYFLDNGPSLTQKISQAQDEINSAQNALAEAAKNLEKVNIADLPTDLAPQIADLKAKMPLVLKGASQLKNWSSVFLEVLGHEHARKYLLVFQNNAEMRPTGGFIGTYGVVDLDEGRLKNLFIDGIFNLDGQLYEKVVPPRPIQKISTAWSMHDANWFADWPISAKKITGFYEAAGGTTVDGVISMTPTVVERLLAIIGPIDLPAYNVFLDQNNFSDLTQYKVEVDYDKVQNNPKKILADFAPVFLDKLWQSWPQNGPAIMKILVDSLAEKHIMFYFTNSVLENTFVEQGWAGEILSTEKDYLSVINTNINGYKTDKVIDQKIYHTATVQNDGSIIDTVRIARTHNGGQSQYDWYNKVNADYLRVYVPLGSKLISAQGQTLEAYSAPIDYQAQNFKIDADVAKEENSMQIDQNSGTQIFEESGKTVFGNWTFVSSGETIEVTYEYLLPFKIDLGRDSESYSLLVQKQSGSIGSDFESTLQLPHSAKITWQYPNDLQVSGAQIKFSGGLQTDEFYGVVLTK